MTIKRRIYRKILGKHYPGPWRLLPPGLKENIAVFGHRQTLIVAKDGNSVAFIPDEGSTALIDIVIGEQINLLDQSLYHRVLYSLDKDRVEDKKIELAWEPTLPPQSRK